MVRAIAKNVRKLLESPSKSFSHICYLETVQPAVSARAGSEIGALPRFSAASEYPVVVETRRALPDLGFVPEVVKLELIKLTHSILLLRDT